MGDEWVYVHGTHTHEWVEDEMTEVMPYDERDDRSGRFTPTVSDDEIVAAVREGDLPGTADIADAVGKEYRGTYDRLKRMERDGLVTSRKIGGSLVWFAAEDDEE